MDCRLVFVYENLLLLHEGFSRNSIPLVFLSLVAAALLALVDDRLA